MLGGIPATGDVLIIAHRRASTLRHNILRGSAKPPTSTGETILFRGKERIIKYMEEDQHSTPITIAALAAAAMAAAIAALFLSSLLHTLTFSLFSL